MSQYRSLRLTWFVAGCTGCRIASVVPFGRPFPARRRAVSASVWVGVVLSWATVARAEESPIALSVIRAKGSEACPDASVLFSTIATLFPTHPLHEASSPADSVDSIFVSIYPSGTGHAAELAVLGPHRVLRRIVDDDPDCRGLPAALAVALVMLHGITPATSSRSAREARRSLLLAPQLGLLSGFGVLGRPAPGGYVGIGIGRAHGFNVVVRAIRAESLPNVKDGGKLEVDLWAGSTSACWRLPHSMGWSITPCAEFGVGAQRGESSGYRANGSATRPWVAAGPSLTGGFLWSNGLEILLTGSVDAALSSTRWVVRGVGTVVRQPAVGAFLGLGLAYHVPIGEIVGH